MKQLKQLELKVDKNVNSQEHVVFKITLTTREVSTYRQVLGTSHFPISSINITFILPEEPKNYVEK